MKESDYNLVKAETINGGLFAERVNDAIQECIANIFDPNVEKDKTREVQATIKLTPHKTDSGKIGVQVKVKTKLAYPIPSETIIYGGTKDGEYVAYEQDVEQSPLPFDESSKSAEVIKMEEADGRSGSR